MAEQSRERAQEYASLNVILAVKAADYLSTWNNYHRVYVCELEMRRFPRLLARLCWQRLP